MKVKKIIQEGEAERYGGKTPLKREQAWKKERKKNITCDKSKSK